MLVHFSLADQIHPQLKDRSAGTKIGKTELVEPEADRKRPWWKLW